MRVLLTTDTVGGVWTHTSSLTEGLLEQGCAVTLVSFGRLPSPEQSAWCASCAARASDRFSYEPSDASLEWMPDNQSARTAGLRLLRRVLLELRPDLVHTNQFCFGDLPGSLPVLVGAHSDVLSWARACQPQGLEDSPWLRQYTSFVAHGLAAANAVVAPTRWMLTALEKSFPSSAARPQIREVIPNGLTVPQVVPSLPKRKLQAVTAGRLWDPAKNISLLTRVQTPMPIVIAGEQADNTEAAHATGFAAGTLRFTGSLAPQDLLHLFRESAVYIVSSLYEPFGLAPLEAALCGCAVLANDLPSLREVWGDAALFFSDAAALEVILADLAHSPSTLAQWQQRAGKRAAHYSRRSMTDRYLSLYGKLLSSSQKPAPARQEEAHVA